MTDWTQRELCPDGNCIGVIGSEGTCKVCGRAAPNWGDERRRGLAADTNDEDEEVEDEDDELDGDSDGDSDGNEGDESDADEASDEGDESDDDEDGDADEDGDEDEDEDDDDEDDDDENEAEGDEDGAIAAKATTSKGAEKAEWSARALCPDGSCIGVIGPNGTCKVCGKRAA